MDTLKKEIEKLPSLRITVEAHGLMAKKALGQNFLLDKNITVNTYQYKDQVGSTSGTSEITPPNTGVVETPNESNQAFYLSGFALLALFLLKKRYEG